MGVWVANGSRRSAFRPRARPKRGRVVSKPKKPAEVDIGTVLLWGPDLAESFNLLDHPAVLADGILGDLSGAAVGLPTSLSAGEYAFGIGAHVFFGAVESISGSPDTDAWHAGLGSADHPYRAESNASAPSPFSFLAVASPAQTEVQVQIVGFGHAATDDVAAAGAAAAWDVAGAGDWASLSEAFAAGGPAHVSSAGVGLQSTQSSSLIRVTNMRADPRFAGIDGSGFSVVIIDTGADLNHSAFGPDRNGDGVADRIVFQYDFADERCQRQRHGWSRHPRGRYDRLAECGVSRYGAGSEPDHPQGLFRFQRRRIHPSTSNRPHNGSSRMLQPTTLWPSISRLAMATSILPGPTTSYTISFGFISLGIAPVVATANNFTKRLTARR